MQTKAEVSANTCGALSGKWTRRQKRQSHSIYSYVYYVYLMCTFTIDIRLYDNMAYVRVIVLLYEYIQNSYFRPLLNQFNLCLVHGHIVNYVYGVYLGGA